MSDLKHTSTSEIPTLIASVRSAFNSGRTRPSHFRKQQLMALRKLVIDREEALVEAVRKDLRKHRSETVLAELAMVVSDIALMMDHLDQWMKPEKVGYLSVACMGYVARVIAGYGG